MAKAMAMAMRCCSPPDKVFKRLFLLALMPTSSKSSFALARFLWAPDKRIGSMTFCIAVK